tara:strand:+ start:645 stop:1367 length:723 start_codon:yes stop_codon:yes gene_type:complete
MLDFSMSSISIMQPYIFPYLGYFHLIESCEKIIFYDDVNFKKRGWIHRNNILLNGKSHLFTIPLKKSSQNKKINEIFLSEESEVFNSKFLKKIHNSYRKAPYFKETYNLIENIIFKKNDNICDLAIDSILEVYKYIDKEIKFDKSSIISPESVDMNKADRLIHITKKLNASTYINLLAGKELYRKNYFSQHKINLKFVYSNDTSYRQFGNNFVNNLSIIDLLMFNSKEKLFDLFSQYSCK